MKKLREMIEQARKQPNIPYLKDGVDPTTQSVDQMFPSETFFHMVEKAQPFVFAHSEKEIEIEMGDIDFGAPFQIWSAEMLGTWHLSAPHAFKILEADIRCILSVEQKDGWLYFAHVDIHKDPSEELKIHSGADITTKIEGLTYSMVIATDKFDGIAKSLVDRMNSNAEIIGTENIREKVKVGTGANKRHLTFKRLIHVRPKKDRGSLGLTGRTIEWTHRWWVRGHWVALKSTTALGKDRNGDYCVHGKTWRVEHTKGPDDGVLVNKTRLITE